MYGMSFFSLTRFIYYHDSSKGFTYRAMNIKGRGILYLFDVVITIGGIRIGYDR